MVFFGHLCYTRTMPDPSPSGESLTPEAGRRPEFATTHWSLVLRATQRDAAGSAAALEKLCRGYWFPLYAFARREGCRPEDAQDLTQEFFSRLLAKEYLKMADPNRGRFRSFLLAAFKHMLANERRAALRLKRGGGAQIFSLDEEEAEGRYQLEPADDKTPDIIFERRWAETTLARVLERLETEYTGQTMRFEDLKLFLIEAKGTAGFAEVATRLGVTESALKSVVHRMRRRYAELFKDEVSQTVADPADTQDEIRHMLGMLAG
jgi:RNA polymerase sigma factor (sigma-70 family)